MKGSLLSAALIAAWLNVMASSPVQVSPQPSTTPLSSSPLAGSSWQLVRFQSSSDDTFTPDDSSGYTLSFTADGRVSARIDCNRGMGTWTSAGDGQLRFGPVALTRAMCPPMPLNDRLPRDFEQVRTYALRDGHLFLSLAADAGVYEFEPMSTTSSTTQALIENTSWTLVQVGDKTIAADSQRVPNLLLDSTQHRVSGSGGCNRIMGSYTLEANRLKFSKMASTMMACTSGMDTEQAFLKVLSQVEAWKISGNKLELLDSSGRTIATLQAAQPEQ